MKHFLKFLLLGLFVECCSTLGFIFISSLIFISNTSMRSMGKIFFVSTFVLGAILVFGFAAKVLSKRKLFFLAFLLAFGYVSFETFIAFMWFPGIRKEIYFWSFNNLIGFFNVTVTLFAVYSLISYVLLLALRWAGIRKKKESEEIIEAENN